MKRRLAVAVAFALMSAPASAKELSGPITGVQDGDTFAIGGQVIRLLGIDAPENGQDCQRQGKSYNCGARSERFLRSLIKGGATCFGSNLDDYDRLLATCQTPDGREINAGMVREGWALAFVKYSTAYVEEENAAKAEAKGLWAGAFQRPWEYRDAKWKGNDAPDPSCPIKGNINRKGVRIYHAPWSRSYDRTKINTAKGERWFCNEAEALSAGWRAPFR